MKAEPHHVKSFASVKHVVKVDECDIQTLFLIKSTLLHKDEINRKSKGVLKKTKIVYTVKPDESLHLTNVYVNYARLR